jgi:O-methyltransferase
VTVSSEINRVARAVAARSRHFVDPRDPTNLAVRLSELAFSYRETLARSHFFDRAFKALVYNGIKGDYLEFGSHGARTITLAYRAAVRHGNNAHMWAFDSFEGLPSASHGADLHPEWPEGSMSTSEAVFHELCRRRGLPRDRYTTVPGFYEQSLRASDRPLPSEVALAYVDCDLYSSTAEVLKFLEPRLAPGAIVAFDDYFCWTADGPSGEQRAADEAFGPDSRWRLAPYVPFGWHGNAFVVFSRD